MKAKLVLLKRLRPVVYEVHIGKISQANNLLFSTKDEELATQIVDSFNKFERTKNKLKSTKNDLVFKSFLVNKLSSTFKKKIIGFNEKIKQLESKKKAK